MPKQNIATIVKNTRLTDTCFALRIQAEEIAKLALAGQFIHIKCGEGSLLRRPISICDVQDDTLSIIVEARGEGTKWLTMRIPGEALDILGPLGKGYDLSGKNTILIGGGIGVPPMLYTARSCSGQTTAILGFRNKESIILENEFRNTCTNMVLTTDDGSAGVHGSVTLPFEELLKSGGFDAILACGPRAMLKAVAELAELYKIPCQVSMEERMGCGVGACLVCACKTQKNGLEEMRHVCKDGPVFPASEVVW